MKKVNLGIIGLGNQGKIHLVNALRIKESKVIAIADISERNLGYSKKKGIRNVYEDYERLLRNNEIDAVVISLPNFLHAEASVKAAEAGKHIFLEKPLARNVKEGEVILSAVKKNNVKLMINFPLRFSSTTVSIHEKIVDGLFGDVQVANATYIGSGPFSPQRNRLGPVPVPSWWFDKNLAGGGALLDLGSHMIDLLSWYFGEPNVIESYLGYVFNMGLEDNATCVLKFKNGPIAIVNVGWFSRDHMVSIQICGTVKIMWKRISPRNAFGTVWGDVKRKFGLRNFDPFYSALKYFVQCVQEDKDPHPSGEEGLRCMRIISCAYEKALRTS